MSDISVDRLTKAYIKLRDRRAELRQEESELEVKQKMIASALLETCKTMGVESLRTLHGTVTRSITRKYWTNDWDAFYEFIKEHDAFQLLQKRITNTNMAQFLEDNPEMHPPGLNVDAEYTISVRRK